MKKIKLAILSVSAGAGHVRAAEAVKTYAQQHYPMLEPIHIDVMDFVPKLFRKLYAESYIHIINRNPALWGYMYNKSDKIRSNRSPVKKIRTAIEKLNTRKCLKAMRELAPDIILSTHFLPPELISKMIESGEKLPPSWVQVTDFDIHALWIHQHMTGYFAASEEIAVRMKHRGIPESLINITGIPIMPVFAKEYSKQEAKRKLGINPDRPVVLLMAGGLGVGGIRELTETLLTLNEKFTIVALAGKNKKLLESLRNLAEKSNDRLIPMGFTNTIEELMAASDIAVTKPGGLTSSECLAMKLPMIVVSPIPGQEERNADFLLENGTAVKACDEATAKYKLGKLLKNPEKLKAMSQNCEKISTPNAAEKVLRTMLDKIGI